MIKQDLGREIVKLQKFRLFYREAVKGLQLDRLIVSERILIH